MLRACLFHPLPWVSSLVPFFVASHAWAPRTSLLAPWGLSFFLEPVIYFHSPLQALSPWFHCSCLSTRHLVGLVALPHPLPRPPPPSWGIPLTGSSVSVRARSPLPPVPPPCRWRSPPGYFGSLAAPFPPPVVLRGAAFLLRWLGCRHGDHLSRVFPCRSDRCLPLSRRPPLQSSGFPPPTSRALLVLPPPFFPPFPDLCVVPPSAAFLLVFAPLSSFLFRASLLRSRTSHSPFLLFCRFSPLYGALLHALLQRPLPLLLRVLAGPPVSCFSGLRPSALPPPHPFLPSRLLFRPAPSYTYPLSAVRSCLCPRLPFHIFPADPAPCPSPALL